MGKIKSYTSMGLLKTVGARKIWLSKQREVEMMYM